MKKKTFIILILPALALVGAWFLRGAFATSNPHSWTNGLVGYWSFDGPMTTSTAGTRDVSNNGNWGTFNGGVKPVGGIVGQALSFDGVDDYVVLPNSASFKTNEGTLEGWLKGSGYFFSATQNGADAGQIQILMSSSIQIATYISPLTLQYTLRTPTGSTNATDRFHFAISSDGSTIRIYINGIEQALTTVNGTNNGVWFSDATNINRFDIGVYQYDNNFSNVFTGLIDEFRIYSRALSANEVKQHYDQTKRNIVINNPSGTPPVGWWKMDENPVIHGSTIRDYSVNANTGTLTTSDGAVNKSAEGKIGKALSFDGTNDYISVPDSNLWDIGTNPFTFEYWLNFNSLTGAKSIMGHDTGSGGVAKWTNIWGYPSTGLLSISQYDTSEHIVSFSWTPTVGTWYHVAITRSGNSWNLYVNGVATGGTQTNSMSLPTVGNIPLTIGTDGENFAYFNGSIDEVRIYNYTRTADQIAADFRAEAYRTIVGTSVPSTWWTNGLVGYWNFDGKNTTSTNGTRDASGNGNWGTFNGGVKPIGGIVGQGLSFDGVDQYVGITSPSFLSNQQGSISFWLYFTSGWPISISNPDAGADDEMRITPYSYANGVKMMYDQVNPIMELKSVADVNQNVWEHWVITSDGSTISMFKNGISTGVTVVQGSNSGQWFGDEAGATTFTLGGLLRNGLIADFTGLIDEVRIYNRALSADEVTQHYQQTRRNLGI